jgi:non-ribosomal peptide synthetase component F
MIEEDVFHIAAAQPPERRTLSIAGCRVLARQFRERVEAHHARALAQVGRSGACPFDLHALLPVPPEILQLGPAHPQALQWLVAHWGTPDGLRHVTDLDPDGEALRYGFFTTGASPHAAIAAIAAAWSALRLVLQRRPQA